MSTLLHSMLCTGIAHMATFDRAQSNSNPFQLCRQESRLLGCWSGAISRPLHTSAMPSRILARLTNFEDLFIVSAEARLAALIVRTRRARIRCVFHDTRIISKSVGTLQVELAFKNPSAMMSMDSYRAMGHAWFRPC
jgi:hypothetical protein